MPDKPLTIADRAENFVGAILRAGPNCPRSKAVAIAVEAFNDLLGAEDLGKSLVVAAEKAVAILNEASEHKALLKTVADLESQLAEADAEVQRLEKLVEAKR
jgi:hypothetical protein